MQYVHVCIMKALGVQSFVPHSCGLDPSKSRFLGAEWGARLVLQARMVVPVMLVLWLLDLHGWDEPKDFQQYSGSCTRTLSALAVGQQKLWIVPSVSRCLSSGIEQL
jgi:hypothetical protein